MCPGRETLMVATAILVTTIVRNDDAERSIVFIIAARVCLIPCSELLADAWFDPAAQAGIGLAEPVRDQAAHDEGGASCIVISS